MFICTVLLLKNPIENRFFRLCLRAYRTSPSSSLCVEANEPPLCFRRKKLSLQYLNNYLLLQSVFQVICKRLVSKRAILLHLLYQPPWLLSFHPIVNFALRWSDKSNTPPVIFRHSFYELFDEFKNYYCLFTDGCKEGYRVAAAVVYRDNIKTVQLPDTASILGAELYAFLLAIYVVKCSKEENFVIFYDSVSSLQSVNGFNLD